MKLRGQFSLMSHNATTAVSSGTKSGNTHDPDFEDELLKEATRQLMLAFRSASQRGESAR